jgi:alpha-glucoside transport system permease protein
MARVFRSAPLHAVLVLIGGLWLLPNIGLLIQSFRPATEINDSGFWTVLFNIDTLTVNPYVQLLANDVMVRAFGNTVLITVPTTVLVLTLSALGAYALSCMRWRGRDIVFMVVVALLVVPIQVALIPIAQLYNALGIFGSILAVILFHTAFGLPFGIFLMRNIYSTIPRELLETAQVDGAGHGRVLWRIALPLAAPGMASLAIFQFVWVWNDLLIAIVFAEPSAAPMTAAIRQQMSNFASNVNLIASGAFIQLLVPMLVFFAFQPYFVQGIAGGALKE